MSERQENYRRFLDPQLLAKLSRLDLVARMVVEGFIAGLHKSPFHGFSAEFSDHRPYMPGDPIRHIDWKVYGKSNRLYLKRYDEDTNLQAYILVDCSPSMLYPLPEDGLESDEIAKLDYANMLAATLAHLLIRQRDAVGAARFDEDVYRLVPPRTTPGHLNAILSELNISDQSEQSERSRNHSAVALHRLAERLRRKGLVVIISDFLTDETGYDENLEIWSSALKHFRYQGHDVILFQVMTPQERSLNFDGACLFEGMETGQRIGADAWAIRAEYQDSVNRFLSDMAALCRNSLIDFAPLVTDQPLDAALFQYLSKRGRMR